MVELTEHTQTLIKNCMIQRLTTDESLDYLEKNNVKISERTFRRYKSEILEIKNSLQDYRLENIQIEQFEGVVDSSTVRWVNDCEMVLSSINPKNRNEKKNILIKILSTTDSSYTYEYSYVGENIKLKAKAFKIK